MTELQLPPKPDGSQLQALKALRDTYPDENGADANFPLDDACLLRYLRARDYNVEAAREMLQSTLDFRAQYHVGELFSLFESQLRKENETGKTYARGFDKRGRAILYMRPAFENTGDHDGNINHLIYNMERACAMLRAKATGVEKLMLLVDYKNYSLFNAPPMKTSRATLDILQNHYPERLGCAMLLNPPFIFRAFWAAISPFIDPVTADKIQFVTGSESARLEHLSEYLDINKLEEGAGGRNTVPFDSQVYMDSALHEDLEALLRPGGTSGSARSARGSVGSESRPVERTPVKPNEG